MRKLLFGLGILSFLAVAAVSHAASVDMRWDSCTGPVDKATTVGAKYYLFVSEVGLDQVHTAYEVLVHYGNATQTVPDAWRFDVGGCEDGYLSIDAFSKTCPAFAQTASLGALQIKRAEFSPGLFDNYPTTLMRVIFFVAYANTPITPVPTTRYLLARLGFDLTWAVAGPGTPGLTCGGFGEPMCFKVSHAGWLNSSGFESPFDVEYSGPSVSFNGPSACPVASPAQAKTWGAIKSQYRQ